MKHSDPAALDKLMTAGIEQMQSARHDEAIATFGALSGYGQIYVRLEQYEKAIAYWRRALQVNPNMAGVEANIESVEELLREKKARSI